MCVWLVAVPVLFSFPKELKIKPIQSEFMEGAHIRSLPHGEGMPARTERDSSERRDSM